MIYNKWMLKPYRGKLVLYILFSFINSGLLLLHPYCYLLFLDELSQGRNTARLLLIFAFFIIIYVVQTIAAVIYKSLYNHIFPQMVVRTKLSILHKLFTIRLSQLQQFKPGDLKERLNDDSEKAVLYVTRQISLLTDLINLVIIGIILLRMNWQLTLFGFIMIPLSYSFTRYMQKRVDREYVRQREYQTFYNDYMLNITGHWKEIRSNNLEKIEEKQFHEHLTRMGKFFLSSHIGWFINRSFIAFKDEFMTKMGLYLFGGFMVIKGLSQVSILLAFIEYYNNFIRTLLDATDIYMKKGKELASSLKVMEILNTAAMEGKIRITEIEQIELKNIDFAYPGESHKVLKHFDMMARRGERWLLNGESGSGKSTVIKILLGLIEPDNGCVLVNGINVNDVLRHTLLNKVGVVVQESRLFNLSIRQNLLFGKDMASEKEIEDACRKANILDFIRTLPLGVDTLIGENGIKLSGGQRQRLILARLFLQKPEVVILDEATSALDSENEYGVIDHVQELVRSGLLIVITHRGVSEKFDGWKLKTIK